MVHAVSPARSPGTREAPPLHEAAETGQVDIIKLLVERGADLSAETDKGDTPAIAAARFGQIRALCCLAELGADLDHRNRDDQTARPIVTGMVASLNNILILCDL